MQGPRDDRLKKVSEQWDLFNMQRSDGFPLLPKWFGPWFLRFRKEASSKPGWLQAYALVCESCV